MSYVYLELGSDQICSLDKCYYESTQDLKQFLNLHFSFESRPWCTEVVEEGGEG